MPVEAIRGRGAPRACVICDQCSREDVVTCDYERLNGGAWVPNRGQAISKLRSRGWTEIKGKIRCPKCSAERRAKGAEGMSTNEKESSLGVPVGLVSEAVREPSGKQYRLIIMALEDAYDDVAKRYRGATTDASLARDLGDGIMPGWVSAIRHKHFGPAGNEEVAALRDQLSVLEKDVAESARKFSAAILELRGRIDDAVAAHDRRVGV